MKLVSPMFSSVIEITEGNVFSLVIEHQNTFRKYLIDLYGQKNNFDGEIVLSIDNEIVSIKKYIEIIDCFTPFDINTKLMLSHINSAIEQKAMDEEHFLKTSELLSQAEQYMAELCFDMPFSAECQKLNFASLLKSSQLKIANDYSNDMEAIIDYMTLLSEFEGQKLFVFVNLRSYFSDDDIATFANTIKLKQLSALLIESSAHAKIEGINQLIVDKDLCEI